MGKRGPKKLPTNVLKIRGSRRVEDRPKNEPVPPLGMPKPPVWLKGEGLAEWKRKAPLLYEQGTLTLVDDTIFAAYCRTYELFVKTNKMMQKQKMVIERKNGSKMQNPLLVIMNQALERMAKLAAEFGMSASGRTGINVPKIPTPQQTDSQKWIEQQGA